MVTRAVGRARHLAVTGVKVAAVAQREAVRPVRAQEVGRRRLDERRDGARSSAVRQAAVDAVKVHRARILARVVKRVDALQPLCLFSAILIVV